MTAPAMSAYRRIRRRRSRLSCPLRRGRRDRMAWRLMRQVFVTGFRLLYKEKIAVMSEIVLALTTLPADFDAPALAQELVRAGLAACVSILPSVQSVYTWQGRVENEREQQLV